MQGRNAGDVQAARDRRPARPAHARGGGHPDRGPEPEGPFGAKGVGEIGLVPTAGAVAGALEAFDGVRRMRLPMKDLPAARAINVGRIADGDRDQWH